MPEIGTPVFNPQELPGVFGIGFDDGDSALGWGGAINCCNGKQQ